MSYSWDLVRSQVRQFRTNFQSIYPIQVLAIVKDFSIHSNILYFLSNDLASADLTLSRKVLLYQIDLSQLNFLCDTLISDEKNYLSAASKLPLLSNTLAFTNYLSTNDKDQDIELPLPGVSNMSIIEDTIMLTFSGSIYVGQIGKVPTLIPYKATQPIRSNSPSSPVISPIDINTPKKTTYGIDQPSRVDTKLGRNKTISFIRDRDIWISDFKGNETQLTFCSMEQDTTLRCGVAEYMMQEEFHRFTGYYWCPTRNRILYLETTEKDVEVVYISKNTAFDSIRYPRAGKPNASSCLKIVDFEQGVVHKQLWGNNDIKTQFPWMEYIVRFGWLPDGQSIWLQILSRDQKRTAVLKLYPSQFTTIDTNEPSKTEIIWQETNKNWINIADVYYFMQSDSLEKVKLIWSSEKVNGFRHLFYIEKYSHEPNAIIKQLTQGEWCCIDSPIYVDESRDIVYFSAKRETPLESHFYVTSYTEIKEPLLLTQIGYSHTVTMDSPDYFVDCFSTLSDPKVILVRKINHDNYKLSCSGLIVPVSSKEVLVNEDIDAAVNFDCAMPKKRRSSDLTNLSDIVPNGEIFKFTTSDGLLLYGCLYKPRFYKPTESYPTVLHIYGGPKTQLVTNEFKFPRLMRYLMSVYFGFAVVIIDSRGSNDRGLDFEAQLQYKLGTMELQDQIEGLKFLNDTKFGGKTKSVIDLKRIAISGWSYGGYLSLMGLAQHPDFFKMAIAGAPVTEWELYDAAYTERYMGLPEEQTEAYSRSNVLSYAGGFPDDENRLLIAHGLIDENVHYRNTEILVSELVKHNKPHYLQVYPSEKHGLRHASVNEHFETLMFYWLTNYL